MLATDSSTPDYPLILSCKLLLDLPELGMITLKSVHRLFLKLPSRDVLLEQLTFSSCSDTCDG